MKNKEVLMFNNGLNSLRNELSGRVFANAIALNKEKIGLYVKALNEAKKPNKNMQEYLDAFEQLKKEYATKDSKGNPVINEGIDPMNGEKTYFYDIPDNNNPHSEFVQKRDKLYEEHKKAIDEYNSNLQEWAEVLLEQESEFKPVMIKLTDVPDEIYHVEMSGIKYMVNGTE